MSLFSILRKNKQEPASGNDAFYSRAEEESNATRGRGTRTRKNGDRAPVDAVLPEKKRARRRLIGAIALVLAAVIGLPMILDSEPKPLGDDVTIQIPSKDKSAKSANSTPPVAAPSSGVDATSSLDPDEEVIEPHAPPSGSAQAQPAKPLPQRQAAGAPVVPAVPSQASASKPKEQSKPVKSAAAPKAESKSDPKPADESDDTARVAALLEGKADPKTSAEKKSGKFVIQVAALATKEKVNELQSKLKDAGIKSYTQKVATDSGERIRIRVGPFANRDEADKARAKIVKLGLSGTIVPA